jgi:mono/diheme cytochrome c family protein
MARWKRISLWTLGSLVVLSAAAISATVGWRPFIGPNARALTDRTFQSTPERLARGQYLVTAVDGCPMCHGEWDRTIDGHPPKQSELMAGRNWSDEALPWLTAPNLTPDKETGAGAWTDDMLARAIREGIGHDGRTLFPVMPYQRFAKMSDEDLASIIVYLRTLPPIRRELPKTEIPFPPGPLINSLPQPITEPVPMPDMNNQLARGEYMTRMAVCEECHSPLDPQGAPIPGLAFAGGFPLIDGGRTVHSKNITQDPSGIPHYDEANFLQMMRTGKLIARDIEDMMPWAFYRNMSDDDLKAIYAFIKTVPPVKHTVDNALPPTLCPVCNYEHGGGDRNVAPTQ